MESASCSPSLPSYEDEECSTPRGQMLPDPLLHPPQAPRKPRVRSDWTPRSSADSALLKRHFEELDSANATATSSGQSTLSGFYDLTASGTSAYMTGQATHLQTQQLEPRFLNLHVRTGRSLPNSGVPCSSCGSAGCCGVEATSEADTCIGSAEHLVQPTTMDAEVGQDDFPSSGRRLLVSEMDDPAPKRQRGSQPQLMQLWGRSDSLAKDSLAAKSECEAAILSPPAPATPRRGNSAYGVTRGSIACHSLLQLAAPDKAP